KPVILSMSLGGRCDFTTRAAACRENSTEALAIQELRAQKVMLPGTALAEEGKLWVTYPGGEGPGKGKHIVLVSGDEEYRSEESMPQMGKILSKHFGFKCTVLFAQNPKTGEIDPDNQNNIPGLEALKTADLMFIVTRFRNLPDEQMQHIDAYLKTGKPVVGMRPATHAFKIPGDRKFHKYSFNSGVEGWEGGFGRQIFGETWAGHHVGNKRGYIRGIVADGAKDHPIVRGLEPGEIGGKTGVYRVTLPMKPEATPIVLGGALQGLDFDKPLMEGEKNNPMMPVAWTHTYEAEPGKKGRAFVTTMGASQDLLVPGFRQMMVQGTFWALGMSDQIPVEGLKVDLVGEFKPNPYAFSRGGNKAYKAGLKPSDYEMKP
ncbi:MAG: ThuA domain-containing protein, partial [Planctomycetota bacterium]